MQLTLILGIIFAIGAVVFALQNSIPVTVTLAFWNFEGSLALVLLLTLGLGALIAGLVSSPAMIRRQWTIARMRRRIADLELRLAEQARISAEFATENSRTPLPPDAGLKADAWKPHGGLRALISGGDNAKSLPEGSADDGVAKK